MVLNVVNIQNQKFIEMNTNLHIIALTPSILLYPLCDTITYFLILWLFGDFWLITLQWWCKIKKKTINLDFEVVLLTV